MVMQRVLHEKSGMQMKQSRENRVWVGAVAILFFFAVEFFGRDTRKLWW